MRMPALIIHLLVDEPRLRRHEPAAQSRASACSALLFLPFFLHCILASLAGSRGMGSSDEMPPLFEQTASNVSGFEGQTVYLPCRVHNLGDKVVSWMRSRDLHILTSGNLSFSSDPRFKPQHLDGSDAWTLRLDRLKKSDAGGYECQVNTEPKIMYRVQLSVRADLEQADGQDEPQSQQTRISYESTAPVAAIMGPREVRVQAGSTVSIRCLVSSPYQTRPLKAVHWLRDNRLLTFQAARGGINVQTVTGMAQTLTEATLSNVTGADSGKYSCRPTEGKLDSILLYVQDPHEELRSVEGMQRDDDKLAAYATSSADRCSNWSIGLHLLCCYCCCYLVLAASLKPAVQFSL